jgi:hypothetical protein
MIKIVCPACGHEFEKTKKALLPPKVVNEHAKTIAEMIEIFAEINPSINYGHKGYRTDAQAIIEKIGVEKALSSARYAVLIQGQPFSPTITTPTALRNKFGDLVSFHKKNAQGRSVVIV